MVYLDSEPEFLHRVLNTWSHPSLVKQAVPSCGERMDGLVPLENVTCHMFTQVFRDLDLPRFPSPAPLVASIQRGKHECDEMVWFTRLESSQLHSLAPGILSCPYCDR